MVDNRGWSASQRDPLSMVYIAGSARSGSTVLATMLGNHPQVFTAGELCDLPQHGWINDEYCACGEVASVCPFWTQVRQRMCRLVGADDVARLAALVRQWEGSRDWRTRLKRETRAPSLEFREYARHNLALLEAIRETSGRSLIVDSSKRASRAYALSMIPDVDLRVIHLVRDGRGVAWSMRKKLARDPKAGVSSLQKPRPPWRSTLDWVRGNLRTGRVLRRLPPGRAIRVRYEDCVTRPGKVLDDISRLVGVDFEPVARNIAAGKSLEVGHVIAGNRLRMAGHVRLKPDTEWIAGMSRLDRWVCWALSGWLLRRYGYQKRPA